MLALKDLALKGWSEFSADRLCSVLSFCGSDEPYWA